MNRRRYISLIVFLSFVLQLFSQSNTRYGILGGFFNESQDTLKIECELLPFYLREIKKLKDNDGKQIIDSLSISALTIDRSLAVGTTIGTADVTATGGASYQIPIEVPQGIAGFEPVVSIGYNSQMGSGLMGYGWNLTAFSAISRCGKTYYHDNTAEAPLLTNSDNLMLDGQRLMLISGQNLVTGAKYRMEYDPFTEIAFKTIGSYPCFVVRTKDGTTREFGSTVNSNVEVTGGSTLFWLLSKTIDKNGNVITYEYEEVANNGEFYLTKIQYAGNRKVQFTYEIRMDTQKSYFAGVAVNSNKILKSVSTYIDQTLLKQYQFIYVYDGFYSKLTEIIEKGQNNVRYNSTIIDYGYSEVQQDEYFAELSQSREGNMPLFADYNGDGKTDFLSYPEKSSYTTSDLATLFLSQNDYGQVGFYKKCTIPIQSSSGIFQGFILADLNGNGRMDVVNISKAANGTYRYNYYMYDGEKLTYDYKGFNTNGNDAITGDFNGDGKQEILVISNQKVFNGDGNEIASGGISDWGSVYVKDYYPNNRYLCDFNGNGKTDILVMNGSSGWVYELQGNSFVRLTSFNTSEINNYYFPYFGDFNGDGKTDILLQNVQSGSYDDVRLLYSTSKGFVKQIISNANIRSKVQVADFNKDGKSDIFHMETVNGSKCMKVGTFNGTDFTTVNYSTFLQPSVFDVPPQYDNFLFPVADFDGDGRAEFCCARYIDSYIIHTFTDNQTLLAKSITNGLGAQTSFAYAPITDEGYCSNSDNNVSFPVAGSLFPLSVVVSMAQSTGNYTDNISYHYKNPRIHLQGKSFLGFSEIEAETYNKDRKVTTKYGYNDYYYPFVTEQKISTRSGTNISSSVFENSYVYQGNKRISPYIRKQTETDYLTGVVNTTECTSTDSWGNPLTIVIKYGSDVTETTTSTYFNSGTDNLWIFSLPLTSEKKTTRGSSNWIDKQTFEYNGQYLLQKMINYTSDGTKKVSEQILGYDGFGNLTSESVKSFSSTDVLTTSYEYSQDGVFRIKKTDPVSLVTTWTYNSSGQLGSSKDPLNNATIYEYDGMGRLIKTTYPDNTYSSTTLSWGDATVNSAYCITDAASGKPTVKTHYDGFYRELRNSILRFDGSEINRDKQYDNAGRIYRESLPFKGSSATLWNTCGYDSYSRLQQLSYASGKSDAYTYSGTSITLTKNGIASEKKFNAKGELVKVTDPAGEIVYNLRPDGQPSSILAPGNVVTSFNYDEYGRRVAIIDPSAGTKLFVYDAAGNLKEETDADNRKKIMSYDQYGRVTSKVLPEFSTSYGYNGYGQLLSVSSDNGTSHTYLYDSYGRLSSERDNGPDSKWFEKSYTYSAGNISSVQFTSHSGIIATENYTYSNGYASEIKLGSTSIWKLDAENGMGLPVSVTTGPVARSYSFDLYGMPTGRSASSSSNGTLMNYIYNFNPVQGNLLFREDGIRNLKENFNYDNLNRLVTYKGSSVEYDNKGNITKKSDIGNTFYYNFPNKPYAVSAVDAENNNFIPPKNQLVSYTSFERPTGVSENGYEALFTYDSFGNRKKMQLKKDENIQYQRYYLGDRYEADYGISSTKQIVYIGGDAYTAPAVYVNLGSSWVIYYICRDYLGSITHLVNSNGVVTEENSYDAWGRLRNPATQFAYVPGEEPELFLGRGFTGHEHLTPFGLINMNARLYDPAIGRFLSPDPFVQMPDFSQGFNRYSYGMNNPFVYVDENGEFFFSLIIPGFGVFLDAMCWGATIGAVTGGMRSVAQGQNFWKGAWKGAITGGVGGFLGPIGGAGMSFAANVGLGVAQGALVGALDATLWGTNIGKGVLWGGVSGGAFATLTSDNWKNMMKGKGFKSNESVFKDFAAGKYTSGESVWQQDAIDYFGFEGVYNQSIKSNYYQSGEGSYYGATNPTTGQISYGDLAFIDYSTLKGTYYKEVFHSNKILNNEPLKQLPKDAQGLNMDLYLDEIDGYVYAFKQRGLYPKTQLPLNGIQYYQLQLKLYDIKTIQYPKLKLFYKIPRRW